MWPYTDDENAWLAGNPAGRATAPQGLSGGLAGPTQSPLIPTLQLTPELMEFHRQRAKALRHDAIAGFFGRIAQSGAEMFRHLSLLSSGNRAKMNTAIAELRQPQLKPRNAANAGR